MAKKTEFYTTPKQDLQNKYSTAEKLRVKWTVKAKRSRFVEAQAELVDMKTAATKDPFTSWQVKEVLRLPDEARRKARDNFIERGKRKMEAYDDCASLLDPDN